MVKQVYIGQFDIDPIDLENMRVVNEWGRK